MKCNHIYIAKKTKQPCPECGFHRMWRLKVCSDEPKFNHKNRKTPDVDGGNPWNGQPSS